MKANLLNDDLTIKDKWLRNPFNKTICNYIEKYEYFFDHLEDYNSGLSTSLKSMSLLTYFLSNIRITETTFGIIIEELFYTENVYEVHYYPFVGKNHIAVECKK